MKRFKQYRPRDINLNIGISSQSGTLDYYDFDEHAYNTTDKDRAQFCIDNEYSKLKGVISIKVVTMKRVLDKHAKGARSIL
ncbi:MAG: hypothetical protein IKN24_00705 [Lachnospiraceae bacterium]|nr:hypothetical protein [Lachnospiraceae bacterium]